MAVTSSQKTVAASAAVLVAGGQDGPQRVVVFNREASNAIYLGASDVSTTTGFKVAAGESIGLTISSGETLYFIAAGAGTASAVHVLACRQ